MTHAFYSIAYCKIQSIIQLILIMALFMDNCNLIPRNRAAGPLVLIPQFLHCRPNPFFCRGGNRQGRILIQHPRHSSLRDSCPFCHIIQCNHSSPSVLVPLVLLKCSHYLTGQSILQ